MLLDGEAQNYSKLAQQPSPWPMLNLAEDDLMIIWRYGKKNVLKSLDRPSGSVVLRTRFGNHFSCIPAYVIEQNADVTVIPCHPNYKKIGRGNVSPVSGPNGPPNAQECRRLLEEKKKARKEEERKEKEELEVIEVEEKSIGKPCLWKKEQREADRVREEEAKKKREGKHKAATPSDSDDEEDEEDEEDVPGPLSPKKQKQAPKAGPENSLKCNWCIKCGQTCHPWANGWGHIYQEY
ncbi:hypothetical protein BU17DRAFT_68404 [Hysterangium stoloniferum]|nr:hypothetical protein BU17DRAFT_68404 [Hysterangium stoloniferum]